MLKLALARTGISFVTIRFVIGEEPTAMVGTSTMFSDSLFEISRVPDVDHRAARFLQHINVMHVSWPQKGRGTPSSEVTGLDCRVP